MIETGTIWESFAIPLPRSLFATKNQCPFVLCPFFTRYKPYQLQQRTCVFLNSRISQHLHIVLHCALFPWIPVKDPLKKLDLWGSKPLLWSINSILDSAHWIQVAASIRQLGCCAGKCLQFARECHHWWLHHHLVPDNNSASKVQINSCESGADWGRWGHPVGPKKKKSLPLPFRR